jgi:hypothetical protein
MRYSICLGFIMLTAAVASAVPVINVSPVQETTGLTEITGVATDAIIYVDLYASNLNGATHLVSYGGITLTIDGPANFIGNEDFTYYPQWSSGYRGMTVVSDTELLITATASIVTPSTYMPLDGIGLGHIGVLYQGPGEVTVTATPAHEANQYGSILWYDAGVEPPFLVEDYEATGGELTINPDSSVTEGIAISKLMVNPGKDRENPSDNIIILGTLTGAPESFAGIDNLNLQIASGDVIFDDLNLSIPINTDPNAKLIEKNGVTNKLKYLNSSESIVIIILDLATGKFSLLGRKIDLTGLKDSISIDLSLDDFSVSADVDEEIINGSKKLVPLCFLLGDTDALRVTQAKVGKKADALSLKGEIAVEDNIDLRTEEVTIAWGGQNFVIPPNSFQKKKETVEKYTLKKLTLDDETTVDSTFDLDKCTFKIKLKNTTIQDVAGTVTLEISFAGFSQTDDWIFPAP